MKNQWGNIKEKIKRHIAVNPIGERDFIPLLKWRHLLILNIILWIPNVLLLFFEEKIDGIFSTLLFAPLISVITFVMLKYRVIPVYSTLHEVKGGLDWIMYVLLLTIFIGFYRFYFYCCLA